MPCDIVTRVNLQFYDSSIVLHEFFNATVSSLNQCTDCVLYTESCSLAVFELSSAV